MKHLRIHTGLSSIAAMILLTHVAHAQSHSYMSQTQTQSTATRYAPSASALTSSYHSSTALPSNYMRETVNCPMGTELQSDGTCLQMGSASIGTTTHYSGTNYAPSQYSSRSTYSSYSHSVPPTSTNTYTAYVDTGLGQTAPCPAGSVMQSDGTCLQNGSASYGISDSYTTGTSVNTYTPSITQSYSSRTYTNTGPSYVAPRTHVPLPDTVYCYRGTSRIFDERGVEIGHVCGQRGQSQSSGAYHGHGG